MKALVTGGAGFIGSHVVDTLIKKKWKVVIIDNLSTGKKDYIKSHLASSYASLIKADVLDCNVVSEAMLGVSTVFHFSANADVRKGIENTNLDLWQGILATYNVLEAMRKHNIKKIVFPSSMTVYGRSKGEFFTEESSTSLPISLYASSKIGSEALISAFAHTFGMEAWIFRFANVIGPRLTHGVIYDLINKLKKDPKHLHVLGDGSQTKPYIYINDVVNAMLSVIEKNNAKAPVNIFNLGVKDTASVNHIVKRICHYMNRNPKVTYDSKREGWRGDVTECSLDISKLKKLGFTPRYSTHEAIDLTIQQLLHF